MNRKKPLFYLAHIQKKQFLKSVKRKKTERSRRAGFQRFLSLIKTQSILLKKDYNPPLYVITRKYSKAGKKPKFNDIITFLIPKYMEFSCMSLPVYENGSLELPEIFSIADNHEESMFFLKRLFNVLYKQTNELIFLDYRKCNSLDVDASACMDLILGGFIIYYKKCTTKGHQSKIKKIVPINIANPEVEKVLLSIGAFKNIKGFELQQQSDIIPFPLKIGDTVLDKRGTLKEIHETQIVDYVVKCLDTLGHALTPESESHLSKVVGEVMANAEEHSNFRYRFAIGYFKKPIEENNDFGTFQLSIFNFGQTIYESFKREECKGFDVVKRMKELSEDFTRNGIFRKAEYEEQTLWTLYALQEGVTSTKDWKRGKGTIRFIDRFFKLKGNGLNDNLSKLTLVSGNTKIIFDGTYPLKEVKKGNEKKPYQMMTFNVTGNIHEKPNNKFVTFVPQYFPGTLITAKISITPYIVENSII